MNNSTSDPAVAAATATAMAMVAIEMVLTLGHRLGKDFDLRAYAEALEVAIPEKSAVERQARRNVVAMLTELSATSIG